jgi:DNA-binding GntR family transcriptional regulator
VEEIYLSVKMLPDFSKELFTEEGINQSTYHVLQEHYNILVKHIDDTMSAETAGDKDAILLDISSNSPVLLRQRISYDSFDRPLSYSNGRYIININFSFNAKNV